MYKRILVPLDGSTAASRGVDEAIGLARGLAAAVHLLHVVDDYPMFVEMASAIDTRAALDALRRRGESLLDEARRRVEAQGLACETRLVEVAGGRVADRIVDEAREARCDLIVMGTHGRRGVAHVLMGSEAEAVLRTSPVPVLLLRPPAKTT